VVHGRNASSVLSVSPPPRSVPSLSVSTDVPAVGHCNGVQIETLDCYGYSTTGTPSNTSNPALRCYSASYVTPPPYAHTNIHLDTRTHALGDACMRSLQQSPNGKSSIAPRAGSWEAPLVGWETLCWDVRLLIFSKLDLRDLARAATVSQDFHKACVARAAKERAALIASQEEVQGKRFFSDFVTALRSAMFGFSPCPRVISANTEITASVCGISARDPGRFTDICTCMDARDRAHAIRDARATGKLYAVIEEPSGVGHVFHASVNTRWCLCVTLWKTCEPGSCKVRLQFEGRCDDAALDLALLTAMCLGDLHGAPKRSPLTVRFVLWPMGFGAVCEGGVGLGGSLEVPGRVHHSYPKD
jgi:hypothetical protein